MGTGFFVTSIDDHTGAALRKPRQTAESNIYHVIVRGAGRQIIFEDDADRQRYLDDLGRYAAQREVDILAWCLMSNHVHLLLEGGLDSISSLMQMLGSEYAQYFNRRYDRVGPLFQGRYKSEPVESEEYLLTVVRYIHDNPARAGIAPAATYRWSSYDEYVGTPVLCRTARVMDILGSKGQFLVLHESPSTARGHSVMDCESPRRLGSDALTEWAESLLGEADFRHLKELPREQRDRKIALLRSSGMSIRQIERITGIGRNIIARAGRDVPPAE